MGTTTYTPEQQAENRKLWAAALRSGRYEQSREEINDGGGGYCCLGVACVIMGLDPDENEGPSPYRFAKRTMGLVSDQPFIEANDKLGLTFPQIADMIESDPTLFTTPEGATL